MMSSSQIQDVMFSVGIDYSAIAAGARKAGQKINTHFKAIQRQSNFATTSIRGIEDVLSDIDKKMPKHRVQFAGWAMSIMFFGMAIQRVFSQVRNFGTKAFQDVMHSVEGSVTGFDMLQGSMKYLGFTVGQALEPLVMLLIPIIDKVSDWVSENEGLVRTIVVIGTVLGGLFAAGGGAVLAINGFRELGMIIGGISAGPMLALAGALAIIGGIAWKSFNETPEAWQAIKDTIATSGLKDLLDAIVGTLGEFVSSLTNITDGTEAIAWTMAWLFSMIVDGVKIALLRFGSFVDVLTLVVESLKAAFYWTRALFTKSEDDADQASKYWNSAKKQITDFNDKASEAVALQAKLAQTAWNGPSGYMESVKNAQEVQRLASRPAGFSSSSPYSQEYLSKQQNVGSQVAIGGQPVTLQILVDGDNINNLFAGQIARAITDSR